jgi:hypothetical protein
VLVAESLKRQEEKQSLDALAATDVGKCFYLSNLSYTVLKNNDNCILLLRF